MRSSLLLALTTLLEADTSPCPGHSPAFLRLTAPASVLRSFFSTAARGVLVTPRSEHMPPLLRTSQSHPEPCRGPQCPTRGTSALSLAGTPSLLTVITLLHLPAVSVLLLQHSQHPLPCTAIRSALGSLPPLGCRLKHSLPGPFPGLLVQSCPAHLTPSPALTLPDPPRRTFLLSS